MPNFSVLMELLGESRLHCVDVGARGGMQRHWRPFSSLIELDAFEPDPVACELQRKAAPASEHWHPYALGKADGEGTLYVVRKASSSSLYPPNKPVMDAFAPRGAGDLMKTVKVDLSKLSTVIERHNRPSPELIKLDVQGAELDVLHGLDARHWDALIGLQVEVEFIEEYLGQALFWDVDAAIREKGFILFDLLPVKLYRAGNGRELHYLKKYVGIARNRSDITRRLIAGDALYLRSPESILAGDAKQLAKYLVVLLMYRCFDEALWLIEAAHEGQLLSVRLRDALFVLIKELAPRPSLLQRADWIGKLARRLRKRFHLGASRKADFWLDRSWDF